MRRNETSQCAISGREQSQQGSPYSITSSARASKVGGTSRPSALAVFRLTTELILGRMLHRQVGRPCPLEDAVDIDSGLAVLVQNVGSIPDQAAGSNELASRADDTAVGFNGIILPLLVEPVAMASSAVQWLASPQMPLHHSEKARGLACSGPRWVGSQERTNAPVESPESLGGMSIRAALLGLSARASKCPQSLSHAVSAASSCLSDSGKIRRLP